jgi:hypothetical protein
MEMIDRIKVIVIIGLLTLSGISKAQISKGFEAMQEYDFFKARKIFKASLKKNAAIANYGLALIHYDRLNHFHSLDSAFVRVNISETEFKILTDKQKIKYQKYHFNDSALSILKSNIYHEAFKDASEGNQPEGYDKYIQHYPGTPLLNKSIRLRDSSALSNCIKSGKILDFETFLSLYPNSEFKTQAEKKLDKIRFENALQTNKTEEYEKFLNAYPQSAFKNDIENALYQLQVVKGTQAELYAFAKRYPSNVNTPQAWEQLYNLFTSDQKTESFTKFKEQFPEFPYQEKISRDFERAKIRLFPIVQDERWGYADSTGKVLIPYQFEDAEYFSENLGLIQQNGKKGFINKNGFKVVVPIYKEADAFVNGLSIVETDSATGIINPRGEWVVLPNYYSISGPYGNFYRVEKDEKYGIIDRNGKAITEIKYDDLEGFTEGLAAFALEGLAGFIDTTGKEVIPAQFEEVGLFNNGLAKVLLNEKYGMINTSGKFIIPAKYVKISNQNENLYLVSGDKRCAYLDSNGKTVVPPSEICSGPILGVEGFQEGLARIERKGKIGFIDKKGRLLIPANLEQAGYFSDGLAPFRKKKKWGYINKSGKVIIEPVYDLVFPFNQGKARVKKNGYVGIINKEGKLILNPQYEDIIELDGFFLATLSDKKYLYDLDLNLILSEFDEIKSTEIPEVFQLIKNQKMSYYHTITKKVFWEEVLLE